MRNDGRTPVPGWITRAPAIAAAVAGLLGPLALPGHAQVARDVADPPAPATELRIGDPVAYCRGRMGGAATGVLSGLVTDSLSAFGLPGLIVRAEWGEELQAGQLRVGGPAQAGYLSDETRPDGLYVLCGIPSAAFRLTISYGDSVLVTRPGTSLESGVGRLDVTLGLGTPDEPAGLFGYIRNVQGAGLSGVRVTMTGVRSVLTDSQGFFALDSLRPGVHLLDVRHAGDPAQEFPVFVPSGEAGEIALTLGPGAPETEGVDLVLHDRERMRGLRELEARRQTGQGYFFSRADLAEEIYYLGEILLVAPGLEGRRVFNGRIPDFTLRRGGASCSPALFVDGRRYLHPGGLTDFFGPELVAVEVHRDRVPVAFKTFDGTSDCASISAWTVAGTGEPESAR